MSERNIELSRRLVEAFNRREAEAWIAYCDPSIELHPLVQGGVSGNVYKGHDGIRSWQRDLEEAWGEDIRLEPEAYFDLGEYTLGFLMLRGRGGHSGVEVAMASTVVTRWRDGLAVYSKGYGRREDALSDLGVSEDELERIDP